MALIVEDGTGKADAESYIAVADATTYHAARGNADWAALASDTVREQMLRKATEYMVQQYRMRWKGVRATTVQALDWPRGLVERPDYAYAGMNGYTTISGDFYFPSDDVPLEVERACAELALKAISGPLAPDLTPPVTREKVGPIEVEYAQGARQTTTYQAVDNLLAPFLKIAGGFLPVVRA
jgi:hypothetical protein